MEEIKTNVNEERVLDGEKCAVIWVPKDTVAFTVRIKYLKEDLSIGEAECVFSPSMAREAFEDGEKWEGENVRYVFNYDKLKELGININGN